MTEDSPDPAPAPSEGKPGSQPSEGRGGRFRGRWRRSRRRDVEPVVETSIESLDVDALWKLSSTTLQKRAADLGVAETIVEKPAIIRAMLRAHAETLGFKQTEGVLDTSRNGVAFLRSPAANYQAQADDASLSQQTIKRFGLLPGDLVTGISRAGSGRERYHTLLHVDLIWNQPASKFKERKLYDDLTPLYPEKRMVLETGAEPVAMRALDLIAPLGRGQRCLLVAPPRAGKTVLLQQIAAAIGRNDPDVDILVLLIDERPEEVHSMRAVVKGEVLSSTFDETVERHLRMADLVMEKAHRMIENGRHVVVLLDSLTRLARACNAISSSKGKLMSGGVEAGALTKPRKFFSAARNVEEGGSLTIIGTVLVETGSRADDLIFEEFKGTGNMEVYLSRDLQERRIYPAINIEKTGTRREELLYHPDELVRIQALRRQLSEHPPLLAMEELIKMLKATSSNAELLMRLKLA